MAWLGWNFQSNMTFTGNMVSITPAQRADIDRLNAAVAVRPFGGALDVRIGTPGAATVSLHTISGELKAEQSGATGSFTFDTRALDRGVHVLRVQQGGATVSRRLSL